MEATRTPCVQSPWRVENHGKPTPHGFHRAANRRRLWNEIRGGGGKQTCHLTDSSHQDHVAAGANPDRSEPPKECIGSVVLVVRELQLLSELAGGGEIGGEALDAYLATSKERQGLTKNGILYYAWARQFDRPIGEGLLPDPGELVDAAWIGR